MAGVSHLPSCPSEGAPSYQEHPGVQEDPGPQGDGRRAPLHTRPPPVCSREPSQQGSCSLGQK